MKLASFMLLLSITSIFAVELKSESILVNSLSQAGKITLSGVIVDSDGDPIIGANIVEKGKSNGTVTDIDGHFSLSVDRNSILQVTYIGYLSQEIVVDNRTQINITLLEDAQALDEVVVVGYGTQKKANLTGAVSTISPEQIEKRPVISTSAALQGLAPGVTVTTQSGSPGGDGGEIRVRGISSFGGSDCAPLVLIDGIEGNINTLDANLIESISVLKDAASSAIYGSRAANGVILVTTKRASKDAFAINYKGYAGWQVPTFIPKVTDGLTFMEVFNVANMNDNGSVLYDDAAIAAFKTGYEADPDNYDWQKAILSGSGFTHNHFVSLSANSNKIHIMPSFGYSNQEGIIRNTGFERYTVRNNMDVNITDKLSLKFDISFVNRDRKQIANEGDIWNYLGRMPTNIPIRRNGKWSEGWVNINPAGYIEEGGSAKNNYIELTGNLRLDYNPVKWLTLTGIVAPKYQTRNSHTFVKSVMTYNDDGSEAGAANTYTNISHRLCARI
ncbi:MAG: SusC/RagA family TonB-linked outer membrane protein [Tannerella sp.]|nr:SusC/RagA family TonB-linked outer membrane protein [Tannerella sp.]